MRTTTIVIVVVLLYAMLSSTFTFWVYDVEVQVKKSSPKIRWSDSTNITYNTTLKTVTHEYEYSVCNPRKAARGKLTILLLGGTNYIISTIVLLNTMLVTIVLGWRLVKFGKSRERLTSRKKNGKENRFQNRKISRVSITVKLNRESQMAVTLLLISGFHIIIHFTYMIDFVLLYSGFAIFNFPKSTMRVLETIEEVTDALNILIRLWNFYAYIITIPSFRVAILETYTCGRWTKARGSINNRNDETSRQTYSLSGPSQCVSSDIPLKTNCKGSSDDRP